MEYPMGDDISTLKWPQAIINRIPVLGGANGILGITILVYQKTFFSDDENKFLNILIDMPDYIQLILPYTMSGCMYN